MTKFPGQSSVARYDLPASSGGEPLQSASHATPRSLIAVAKASLTDAFPPAGSLRFQRVHELLLLPLVQLELQQRAGRDRVARPFGFALTHPGGRLSHTRLFPRVICVISRAFLCTFIWSLLGRLKLRNLSFLGSDQMDNLMRDHI